MGGKSKRASCTAAAAVNINKKPRAPAATLTAPLVPLHPVQEAVARRVRAAVEAHGGAYLIAPPGHGKSAMLRAVLEPGGALNVVALPSAELVEEMRRGKMEFSVAPPFNASRKEAVRRLVQSGAGATIGVTHDFVRKRLSPPAQDPTGDWARFLCDVGAPQHVVLVVDEAHNLCANGKWAARLAEQRAALAARGTRLTVVLASATPRLAQRRVHGATALMLFGARAATPLPPAALVSYTDDESARFRADLFALPPPAPVARGVALAPPGGVEALEPLVGGALRDLGTLVVGDFLYMLDCAARGKPRRREIHAVRAVRNLVAETLAVQAHHSANGAATGGAVFAALEDKQAVPAARVGAGGTLDGGKKVRARESALVLHAAPRGLLRHDALLDELGGGGDGVLAHTYEDLSLAESNSAKHESAHDRFLAAFQARERASLGLVLPKNVEGTDRLATHVTKVVVVGPMDGKVMAQLRGRFDRPPRLVEGQLVRREATQIVHLQSAWAERVLGIERLSGVSVLDAPQCVSDALAQLLTATGAGGVDRELVSKMGMRLAELETQLMPGTQLVKLFFTILGDEKEHALFMRRAGENGARANGNYWSVVAKWMGDAPVLDDMQTTSSDAMERELEALMEEDAAKGDDDEEEEGDEEEVGEEEGDDDN